MLSCSQTARQYIHVNSPSEILARTASMSDDHRHHEQPGSTYLSTIPVRSWPEQHRCQKNIATTNRQCSTYLLTMPVRSWPEHASMSEEHRHHEQPGSTYMSTVPVRSWPEQHRCQKNIATTNRQAVHTCQQSQWDPGRNSIDVRRTSPPRTARQYIPVNSPSEILARTASMSEEHRHHEQPGSTYLSTIPVRSWPEQHRCQARRRPRREWPRGWTGGRPEPGNSRTSVPGKT